MAQVDNTNRILVGVDGSDGSIAALGWALSESRSRKAGLVAVYAWHIPALAYSAAGYAPIAADDIAEEGRKVLATALAKLHSGPDDAVELRVVEGPADQVLADIAAEDSIALVVVGSRGHGPVASLVLGSVSHTLSHHCPKPVVIVPHHNAGDFVPAPIGHVVVGDDGSEGARLALEWAADEALRHDALLEVVTAWPRPVIYQREGLDLGEPYERAAQREAEKIAAGAAARLDSRELRTKTTVQEGVAAEVLIERARKADLLVVGTRGMGRAKELFLGSVSHSCSHRSPVAVVIVPHG